MQVGIIADDLTGAMDSGAQLARAGYRVAVMFYDAPLSPFDDFDGVVVDTDSRQRDPGSACRRVSESAQRLKHARILYKKIDSTLRGWVAEEIEAAFREGGRPSALIAPAFPGNGRTTREGVQMVHGEPVHETRFAEDPVTPVIEGHVPTLLSEASVAGIDTLGIGDLGDVDKVCGVLAEYWWVVADAIGDAQLRTLVEAVPDPAEVLWIGSAGLVKALGEVYPGPRTGENSPEETVRLDRVLVVVDSMNEVSRKQLRRLEKESEVEAVEISATALVDGSKVSVEHALRTAIGSLGDGKSVTLYSSDDELPEGDAGDVVEGLAGMVAGLSEDGLFDALILTRGDTALHVARGWARRVSCWRER